MQKIGLERFGLSSDEAKVYLELLDIGGKGVKVGFLHQKLDIKRPTIYSTLERLIEKNWVKEIVESPKGTKIFAANPYDVLLKGIISEKREELKVLESFQLLMGESLLNSKTKTSNKEKDSKLFKWKSFNFETLGITGLENNCDLIIFEFDYNVGDDEDLIKSTLNF